MERAVSLEEGMELGRRSKESGGEPFIGSSTGLEKRKLQAWQRCGGWHVGMARTMYVYGIRCIYGVFLAGKSPNIRS
jgi:hypothetical protein